MEAVQNILTDVLDRLGATYSDISVTTIAGQTILKVAVDDDKHHVLVGRRGEVVRALDYMVKKIAEQKGLTAERFLVDVNDYRTQHIEQLRQKAYMMADRARSLQYDVELAPMSAYERLIIHTTLADSDDIETESHGEGRNRRVVIRYGVSSKPDEFNAGA